MMGWLGVYILLSIAAGALAADHESHQEDTTIWHQWTALLWFAAFWPIYLFGFCVIAPIGMALKFFGKT